MRHEPCLLLLAVALTGCPSSFSPGDDAVRSGSRLRVERYEPAEGGPAMYRDVFDTEIDDVCAFTLATDGRWRCLPQRGTLVYYRDGACTQPIVEVTDCPLGRWRTGRAGPPAACDEEVALQAYEVGAIVEVAQPYRVGPEGCVEASSGPDAGWAALTPVGPERFVAAERRVLPQDDARIGRVVFAAEDGSVSPGGFYDHMEDAPCAPQGPGGPRACTTRRPTSAVLTGPDCEAALGQTSCEPEGTLFFTQPARSDGCGFAPWRVYAADGPPVSVDPAIEICPRWRTLEDIPSYRLRAIDDELARFSDTPVGDGRLRRYPERRGFFSHLGEDSPYLDTELSLGCTPMQVGSETRCVPVDRVARELSTGTFVDPGCTRAALREPSDEPVCGTYVAVPSTPTTCVVNEVEVYRRGAEHPEGFVRDDSGACVTDSPGVPLRYVELEPVPPETFALMRVVTD